MKYCFFGSGIHDALIGNPPGGAELQVALIAKALAEKGHQVSIIDNKGSGIETNVGNISVLYTAKSKIRGLRYIYEKIPNSLRYLFKVKADFYYTRGFSFLFLMVLYVSWYQKAKFILGIASDIDVLSFNKRFLYVYKTRTSLLNWLINDLFSGLAGEILLRNADSILVQHSDQQKALYKRKIVSVVYPNIISVSAKERSDVSDYFIYVGSLNKRKGLSELLELITNCSCIKIKIFGNPQGNYAVEKVKIFKKYKNVEYLGQMPREVIISEIEASLGLINFSKKEGFPNTFLEAWMCGIPVFSLSVDPGMVIEKYNLGKCFHGDLSLMSSHLITYIPTGASKEIKEYVASFHSFEKAADRFLEAISSN